MYYGGNLDTWAENERGERGTTFSRLHLFHNSIQGRHTFYSVSLIDSSLKNDNYMGD